MIIEASAPVRIDFAGGAFDVLPLYLFEGGGARHMPYRIAREGLRITRR